MILSAHQPQFIPWLGYFDKMLHCDLFVLLDDVQFKKNEWQNRNKVWSREGGHWLTLPVVHSHDSEIRNVTLDATQDWRRKHVATLTQTYGHAKHFASQWERWNAIYKNDIHSLLDINIRSIDEIRKALRVETPMKLSSTMGVPGRSTERLVNLCQAAGADTYLAGAGGRDYMDMGLFEKAGIKVVTQDYKHPAYSQFDGKFVSHLCAADLIWHHGPDAPGIFRGRE